MRSDRLIQYSSLWELVFSLLYIQPKGSRRFTDKPYACIDGRMDGSVHVNKSYVFCVFLLSHCFGCPKINLRISYCIFRIGKSEICEIKKKKLTLFAKKRGSLKVVFWSIF